jgi:hypothetical protein
MKKGVRMDRRKQNKQNTASVIKSDVSDNSKVWRHAFSPVTAAGMPGKLKTFHIETKFRDFLHSIN